MEATPPPVPPSPPVLPAEPPPLPPPPPFRLHFSAWIVWGGAVVVILALAAFKADALPAYEWGRRFGMALSLLLFPTLISWIAFRVSRRSQAAATTTFFVVFGLSVLGQVLPLVSAGLSRAGGGLTAVQEGGKKYTERLQAMQARYDELTTKADATHLLNFGWLTDKALIAPRREGVKAIIAMNQEIRQATVDGEKLFRQALEESGASGPTMEEAMRGFKKARTEKLPLMLKARDTEGQIFADALKLLDLLEAEWGHWSLGPGGMAFENDSAIASFNAVMQDIQAAAKEQTAAQRQLTVPVK